jgi:hypothetical protein
VTEPRFVHVHLLARACAYGTTFALLHLHVDEHRSLPDAPPRTGWNRMEVRPAHKPTRHRQETLSETECEAIRAAIRELPPLTDEQIGALCETIRAARKRWNREDQTTR